MYRQGPMLVRMCLCGVVMVLMDVSGFVVVEYRRVLVASTGSV